MFSLHHCMITFGGWEFLFVLLFTFWSMYQQMLEWIHTKQAGFLLMTCWSLLKGRRRRNCYSEKANVLSCCWSLWSVSAFFIKKSIAGTSNIAACWSYGNGDRPIKSGAWRTGVSVASLNIRLNKSAMLARFIYLCNWNESYSCRKIFSGTWLLVSTWSDSKTTQTYQMEPLQHEWIMGRTQFAWKCFEA